MNSLKVERLSVSILRSVSSLVTREVIPSRVIVRRLDAHLKFCRLQRRCLSTTSSRNHAQPELIEPGSYLPPRRQDSRQQVRAESQKIPLGLPQSCPGCGALTQESKPDQAGYYSSSRRIVKRYLRRQRTLARANNVMMEEEREEETEEDDAEDNAEHDGSQESQEHEEPASKSIIRTPLCDRCHDLTHNSRGHSIAHPTIDSIADSIAESPFKRNHIYHVIDAADFPMSLVPEIFTKLTLAKPRSQNRRSQHDFSTKPTMSFIITRSDLLGSTKEMVDGMMAYFQSVLRQALGRAGRDMRLGNIHLVSAKRGWWTKEIKEDIWKRGGGNWMMGKVNVGKSNLFEVLFPKGSGDRAPVYAELRQNQQREGDTLADAETGKDEELLPEDRLLPPAQFEDPFPVMPVVSSLPGTTASPIRLPFGGHRGELIDLPGLERGNLEDYVKSEHKLDLVMTHRHNVEQHTIKAGQSLLLGGGLIRITPQLDPEDRSTTVLAYPFVPLKSHVTSTEKASAQQLQERESGIESILEEKVGTHMATAGIFELDSDITKARSGPLVRAGVNISKLPYRVYGTDILLEGVGWIELVCQVRRRHRASQPAPLVVAYENEATSNTNSTSADDIPTSESSFATFARQPPLHEMGDGQFPKIEVFSLNGKHVSQRPCLQAWTRWNADGKGKSPTPSRGPRRSNKRTRR